MKEHKPGYKLDALIAEKIFGCKVKKTKHYFGWGDHYECACKDKPHALWDEYESHGVKRYSTSMTHAWEVVEKLQATDTYIRLGWDDTCEWEFDVWNDESGVSFSGCSDISAPHAICLAALKAVGAK